MPTSPKPPVEKKTPPHPLVAIVDRVVGTKVGSSSSSGGGSSIVVYVVLIGVAVLGFAIVGWLLVRSRRRAAQLAYELRKKEEEQKRVAEDHKLAKNAKARSVAHKKVKQLEAGIQGLKKKLEDQKKRQAIRAKALEDATSWKDLGL